MNAPVVKNIQASQFEAIAAGDGYVVIDTTRGREVTPEQPQALAQQNAARLNTAISHSRKQLALALGAINDDERDDYGAEVHTYAI